VILPSRDGYARPKREQYPCPDALRPSASRYAWRNTTSPAARGGWGRAAAARPRQTGWRRAVFTCLSVVVGTSATAAKLLDCPPRLLSAQTCLTSRGLRARRTSRARPHQGLPDERHQALASRHAVLACFRCSRLSMGGVPSGSCAYRPARPVVAQAEPLEAPAKRGIRAAPSTPPPDRWPSCRARRSLAASRRPSAALASRSWCHRAAARPDAAGPGHGAAPTRAPRPTANRCCSAAALRGSPDR
jgi:hypothetical protein